MFIAFIARSHIATCEDHTLFCVNINIIVGLMLVVVCHVCGDFCLVFIASYHGFPKFLKLKVPCTMCHVPET